MLGQSQQPLLFAVLAAQAVGTAVQRHRNLPHPPFPATCEGLPPPCESVLPLEDVMYRIDHPINAVEDLEPLAFEKPDARLGGIEARAQLVALTHQLLDIPRCLRRGTCRLGSRCSAARSSRSRLPLLLPIPLRHSALSR